MKQALSVLVSGFVGGSLFLGLAGCKSRSFKTSSSPTTTSPSSLFINVADFTGTLKLPKFPARKEEAGDCEGPLTTNDPSPELATNSDLSKKNERRPDGGVYIEIDNSPRPELIGKRVWLRFEPESKTANWAKRVTFPVRFTQETRDSLEKGNNVHNTSLNCLDAVSPLESLAGGRPDESTYVMLKNTATESPKIRPANPGENADFVMEINHDPIQISGPKMALVQFVGSIPTGAQSAKVRHYNPASGDFKGGIESEFDFDMNPVPPTTAELALGKVPMFVLSGIEKDPSQEKGWYAYGRDVGGRFKVTALEPRALLTVSDGPTGLLMTTDGAPSKKSLIYDRTNVRNYVDKYNFDGTKDQQGTFWSVMLHPFPQFEKGRNAPLITDVGGVNKSVLGMWTEGTRALNVYIFGGIGNKEKGAGGDAKPFFGLVTGHMSFGEATVVKAPFTGDRGELRFDIVYRQVYAHNPNGIIAGTLKWHDFQGHFKRGWLYTRPQADAIIKMKELSMQFKIGDFDFNALDGAVDPKGRQGILGELEKMAARFRVGDGDQKASVTPFTSCVQDSAQAMHIAIARLRDQVENNPSLKEALERSDQKKQLEDLFAFAKNVDLDYTLFTMVRKDWKDAEDEPELSGTKDSKGFFVKWVDQISPAEGQDNIFEKIKSFGTMIPRTAFDKFTKRSLDAGATVWMIRTNQLGGRNERIVPMAPTSILAPSN